MSDHEQQESVAEATPNATATSPTHNYSEESVETLMEYGRRFLASKKYVEASEALSFAVEKKFVFYYYSLASYSYLLNVVTQNESCYYSAKQYGELSEKGVDVLMLYGSALLQNAISQSEVFGDNLGKREKVVNGATGGEASSSKQATTSMSSSSVTTIPEQKQQNKFFFENEEGEEENEEDEDEDGDQEEDDGEEDGEEDDDDAANGQNDQVAGDNEDDFEIAFEILETARVILSKSDTEQSKNKLVEVHKMLGDVSRESGSFSYMLYHKIIIIFNKHTKIKFFILFSLEQFESAAEEYLSTLALQTQLYPAHDRRLAETHILIALALEFVPENPNTRKGAIEHAMKAREVLLLKKAELEKMVRNNKEGKEQERKIDDKEIKRAEIEIKDINEVMEDLMLKVITSIIKW